MKQIESVGAKTSQGISPPPPPPPPLPLPRFWVKKTTTESVTNKEIAKFWRQKRVEEEEHLLAAIKAAARVRARTLSVKLYDTHLEEDYRHFEESLKDEDNDIKEQKVTSVNNVKNDENNEIRVGIKDWWTKSKYAYLNQPAIESMDSTSKRRASSYTPNCFSCKSTPLYPTTLGVF